MKRSTLIALTVILAAGIAGGSQAVTKKMPTENAAIEETATLAGGCFWCLDAVYREMEGVRFVTAGYAGGDDPDPTYKEVCTGQTGHAEAVQVVFDPRVTSYRELLAVFFTVHDPTTLNRQGADVGTQYRSAIFTQSPEQEKAAREVIAELEREQVYSRPVVTQVGPLEKFHPAEDHHQDYYRKNPTQGYCRAVINPKLDKFREHFADKRKR